MKMLIDIRGEIPADSLMRSKLTVYFSKVVLFFDIEQPESLNSYKVKSSVVAYVMKRQSLNESGNTSSFTGCF